MATWRDQDETRRLRKPSRLARVKWLQDMSAAGRRARVCWQMETDELSDEQVGQLARVIDEARLHGEADQYARGYAAGRGGTLKADVVAGASWSPDAMRLRGMLDGVGVAVQDVKVGGGWVTMVVDQADLERLLREGR